MKISDTELLQAIWLNQLKQLSKGVLGHYVGDSWGVCSDDDFWYEAASGEGRVSRQNVTSEIGSGQLLSRLRALSQAEKIKFKRELTFFIDSPLARKAFQTARVFWLQNGVPTGHENGKARTAKVDNIELLKQECESLLIDKFPVIDSGCALPLKNKSSGEEPAHIDGDSDDLISSSEPRS